MNDLLIGKKSKLRLGLGGMTRTEFCLKGINKITKKRKESGISKQW